MNEPEAIEQLTHMGLTEYQARVYTALATLGPSSVTEIYKASKVPRTKVYETLDELLTKGVVEQQPSRPIVYRAIRPTLLTKRMTDDYVEFARKARELLEANNESVTDPSQDLVWIVRGDKTIRRKLAEFLITAKKSIFAIESYPPFFINSVKSLLKAGSKKGLTVRAVCIGKKGDVRAQNNESDPIEYRTFKRKIVLEKIDADTLILESLEQAISSPYCLVVVDDIASFVIIQNVSDETRTTGLWAKIGGVSIIQRIMFERLFMNRTLQYTER